MTENNDSTLSPPTFEFLATTFASQALIHLGEIPNPVSGAKVVDLPHAKHAIDILESLDAQDSRWHLDIIQ